MLILWVGECGGCLFVCCFVFLCSGMKVCVFSLLFIFTFGLTYLSLLNTTWLLATINCPDKLKIAHNLIETIG